MLICGKESRKSGLSLCSFRAGIILKRWGIPLQRFGISSVVNQLIVKNLYLRVECFHPLGGDGSEGLWHILRSPNGLRDCRQRWRRGIWRICSISKRASDGGKKTGVDGSMDWSIVQPFISRGRMPNFRDPAEYRETIIARMSRLQLVKWLEFNPNRRL